MFLRGEIYVEVYLLNFRLREVEIMLNRISKICVIWALMAVSAFAADRPILLVTPQGVWLSTVTNGVPGPFVAMPYDVIVQGGIAPTPGPGSTPVPDTTDPVVTQVKSISNAELKDQKEATAVAAIVNSLAKMGLGGSNFKQALEMSAPIADTSLQAGGRINKWTKAVLAVTSDPTKIAAGLTAAFNVNSAALAAIHSSATDQTGAAVSEEALDFIAIIEIIKMIIALLKSLGIVPM